MSTFSHSVSYACAAPATARTASEAARVRMQCMSFLRWGSEGMRANGAKIGSASAAEPRVGWLARCRHSPLRVDDEEGRAVGTSAGRVRGAGGVAEEGPGAEGDAGVYEDSVQHIDELLSRHVDVDAGPLGVGP